ncbi:hypothetical protein ACJDU8_00395 [Clostridium sp. WILCCON 0269]|uniref:Uncharacterized protein n=1 Tax=Candidatus Clostridium eludens TaxID=3381663 RepID=A0ABW8SDV3_9CLOT
MRLESDIIYRVGFYYVKDIERAVLQGLQAVDNKVLTMWLNSHII